jgi:hypothetical protein
MFSLFFYSYTILSDSLSLRLQRVSNSISTSKQTTLYHCHTVQSLATFRHTVLFLTLRTKRNP